MTQAKTYIIQVDPIIHTITWGYSEEPYGADAYLEHGRATVIAIEGINDFHDIPFANNPGDDKGGLTDLFFWISYGYCIIGSTFFRLFVSPSATTILIRSGIMNGNTHQPSTVTRPTGPALLVYIIINQAVPNA